MGVLDLLSWTCCWDLLALVAAEIYQSQIRLDDVQLLWKWKVGFREHGFSDEEIDTYLAHLYQDK